MDKLLIWALFILPWLSLIFMNHSSIRRYMPVAFLATIINTIIAQIAWFHHWWKFNESLFYWDKIAPLFTVYGVFLIGTMWIFYFTFNKFWIYMLVNAIIDFFYGFIFSRILNMREIREDGEISSLLNFLLMMFIAVILYLYQLWQDKKQ